jgi:heme exporter protein A
VSWALDNLSFVPLQCDDTVELTRHRRPVIYPRASLDLEAVSLSRGNQPLLDGLTLSLGPSAVLWLTGPNGSGKTSLLLACAGLIPLDQGSIRWNADQQPQGHVSYMAFSGPERDGLTLREELSFWQAILSDKTPTAKRLDAVGLAEFSNAPVSGLSTGQRRRLALARLTLLDTPIWLLDEPLSGLDKDGQTHVVNAVTEHSEKGGITLIASHHPLPLPNITAKQLVFEAAA